MEMEQKRRRRAKLVAGVSPRGFPAGKDKVAVATMRHRAVEIVYGRSAADDADSVPAVVGHDSGCIRTQLPAIASPDIARVKVSNEATAHIVNGSQRLARRLPSRLFACGI